VISNVVQYGDETNTCTVAGVGMVLGIVGVNVGVG